MLSCHGCPSEDRYAISLAARADFLHFLQQEISNKSNFIFKICNFARFRHSESMPSRRYGDIQSTFKHL